MHARLEEGQAEQAVCSAALQAAAARRVEMEMQADALERRLADTLAASQARHTLQAYDMMFTLTPKVIADCHQGDGVRLTDTDLSCMHSTCCHVYSVLTYAS